jgi:predicted 3-demethylubiquinone-9 3-methyltransferase (glyoxalase superfamily)
MPHLTPNLWFDGDALEAAEFYCSIFPNSKITTVTHHTVDAPVGEAKVGDVLTVSWELDGQDFTGINGGPMFQFSEAVSLLVNVKDQEELDYYWYKLIEGGGEESQCGWLKDKFGFSWQVCPENWEAMLTDPDTEAVQRATNAMYGMKKLDIQALQDAFDGK